jgi:hypothetical protein
MKGVLALAALPPALVTLALGVLGAAELIGARPLGQPLARSLPEAIVLGDAATAVRLLEQGAVPGEIGMIRRRLLFDQAVLATSFEAAVLARDGRMLDLLQSYGGIGAARSEVACLARDINEPTLAAHLSTGEPSGCEEGRAFANLVARPGR